MEDKAKVFLRSQLEAGKRFAEIRREMISQGYGTEGFKDAYSELLIELNISEEDKNTFQPDTNHNDVSTAGEGILPVWTMFKFASRLTFSHMSSVLMAMILVTITTLLSMLIPESPTPYLFGPAFVVVKLVELLVVTSVYVVSAVALFYVIVRTDDDLSYLHGLQWSIQNYLSVVWLSLLTVGISFTGSLVLIVPGLVFIVYNIFSLVVLVREKQRGITAVIRSTDLVFGNFWKLVARLLLIVFFVLVLSLPVALLSGVLAIATSALPAFIYVELALMIFIVMVICTFVIGAIVSLYDSCVREKTLFDMSSYKTIKWVYRITALVGFLLSVGLVLVGGYLPINYVDNNTTFDSNTNDQPYPSERSNEEYKVSDLLTESKLNETYASVLYYRSRTGSYDGACSDVVIEESVSCREIDDSFVLYTLVSNGEVYCRDSNGFTGNLKVVPNDYSCQN